jgi:hypothetical protein
MPLSDEDKKRIEKEFEEEQHRKEEELYRTELEVAARVKYDEENPGSRLSVYDHLGGWFLMVCFLGLFFYLINLLVHGVLWGVSWLLR